MNEINVIGIHNEIKNKLEEESGQFDQRARISHRVQMANHQQFNNQTTLQDSSPVCITYGVFHMLHTVSPLVLYLGMGLVGPSMKEKKLFPLHSVQRFEMKILM